MINSNSNNNLRIEYIDIAKAIAIFLVVFGHVVDTETMSKAFIYTFHMPAFFYLSGLVLKERKDFNLKARVLNKFYTIMVPYCLWGIIYTRLSFKNWLYLLYGTRETLSKAEALTSLWFLPVLFFASIGSECIIYYSSKVKSKNIFLLLSVIASYILGFLCPHNQEYGNPWGIDISFVSIGFMLIGYWTRLFLVKIKGFMSITIVLITSFVALVTSVYFNNTSVGYVLMANGIYGNPVLFLLGAIGGIGAVVVLAKIIESILLNKEFLLFIGRNTLGIFLVHKPFANAFRSTFNHIGWNYNNFMIAICISMVCVCISVALVWFINRSAPILFGRKQR